MLLKQLMKFAFFCTFSVNCVLTIAPSNGGIKTKIYHQDSQFLQPTGNNNNNNANYETTTHNSLYMARNYDDDLMITYNSQGSTPTASNKLYENLQRNNYNQKQQNNEKLQGQYTSFNNIVDNNKNAIYVENNIISHRSECPPGETGQFPYMYDCKRFLNCWKGRGFVQACAPGTVFNPRSLECDTPQKVNCNVGGFGSARIEEYPSTSQHIPRTKLISDTEDNAITCSPGISGLKPHPFECNKFLNCDHGRTFIQNCGPGTVFNPLMSVCDFPYNVHCGGKTISSNVVVEDSASTGTIINYNIRQNYNENSQQNYNQNDRNRNPKQYNGHGSSTGYSQTVGYGANSSPGYSHNTRHSSSSSGYSQTNGESLGYSQISGYPHHLDHSDHSGYPHHSDHSHHSGYPQPHRHHVTQQTIPVWTTPDTRNPSTNNYPTTNNIVSTQMTTIWNPQQQQSSSRTTTRQPSYWRGVNRNEQAPQYQTTQSPKSVYDKPYDINQASMHEILQNNNLDNNSTTNIYYATPVDYNSDEIFGKDDNIINTSYDLRREENQKHIPFNLPRQSTTTTTTVPPPPVVKFQPYPVYDRRDQVNEVNEIKNISKKTTFKPKIYYGTSVGYNNSEENFKYIAGGDIPAYDPLHENDNEDKNNTVKPIYFGDVRYIGITPPSNHILPPHIPITTPSYNLSSPRYPNDNKTNIRYYPITQNNPNLNLKQNSPSVTPIYSGVSNSKNPSKPYDQPYIQSVNSEILSISNQIKQSNPEIIFNHNDGVILNELNEDESVIVPIYERPTRPTTILYSTQPQSTFLPLPSLYNQITITTPKPITVTSSKSSTINNILDFEIENLPLSDALKILLRPYVNKNENINEHDMKKLESHIMKLENIQAKENLKKQVEIIVTGEQEHMANRSFNDESTSKPSYQHHHINHHHQHTQHSKEFHRNNPNLPNPFENDNRSSSTYNRNPTNVKPKITIHPDAETVSIDRRVSYSAPVHRNTPELIDAGQKLVPVGNFGGNHHHQHIQHSEEFHRNHPNLPNPFENDNRSSSTYNRTVTIDRRTGYNIPVNKNTSEPTDNGEKLLPVGNFGGSVTGAVDYCQFNCGNGKCIKHFEVCDGINHCGNRKDEQNCNQLGYEVRLMNDSNNKHMGRIEVKVNGNWGYVCDDKFDMNDANVVCRELGFPMGASEIRGNSYYLPSTDLMNSYNNISFVMDELDCVGNETSLRDCDFKGWGVHDCNADEVVGVVCKIPIIKCPHDYWLCATSMECIPPKFVCDNTVDCADGSDESNDVCKSKIEYRLVNGNTRLEGRVEIKYRNEWGTICDDDFSKDEAAVVCKNLGYYGPAEVLKNTYGSGYGPIWLDQVSCFGNETCLDQCTHWKWGENNCNHSEDVSIRCSIGSIRPTTIVENSGIKGKTLKDTEIDEDDGDDLDYLFYNTRSSKVLDMSKPKCGYYNPDILDEDYEERQMQRIIHGNVARLGRHPWQATIRVKGVHGMSSHLCGAVLISRRHLLTAAHCISDYEKGAFFIRLGDHRTDRKENYEKDVFIHDWYIHENYRKINHMNNDIALIVIKEPVHFSDYIQPICLPDENAKYDAEKMCTISGWGSDRTGQSAPSKVLRAAEVPILSNNVCKQPEVYGRHITEGMFCAGFLDGKFDACDGDSGGPMACTDGNSEVLYGITSWGLRCGHENKPGVYVKISQYIEWIKRKINHSTQLRNK